ncbi:hypothetical protein BLOT_000144 [Blomia tropicalis]|nr:hypothetical protein BLOT_000144 [Blomia tropicalis]
MYVGHHCCLVVPMLNSHTCFQLRQFTDKASYSFIKIGKERNVNAKKKRNVNSEPMVMIFFACRFWRRQLQTITTNRLRFG